MAVSDQAQLHNQDITGWSCIEGLSSALAELKLIT